MRFASRTFLWSFVPITLLLGLSFGAIHNLTNRAIRDELRVSLRRSQIANAELHARNDAQRVRFLRVVGDNAPLKAGLQLVTSNPEDWNARRTLEEQMQDICENLALDFLVAADPGGHPLAGVLRRDRRTEILNSITIRPPAHGIYSTGNVTYEVTSVPVDRAGENLGMLSVGEQLDFSGFSTPVVLSRGAAVLQSNVPDAPIAELQQALTHCGRQPECEVWLGGQRYLALAIDDLYASDGYVLRSMQNVDAASAPLQSILQRVFLAAAIGAMLAALALSIVSSRSIVKPIATLIAKLHASPGSGLLPRLETTGAPILEIRELMQSFNLAAEAVEQGRNDLHRAYVEFVGSLANALDARDPYTAGHSRRVSEGACAIAEALKLPQEQVDEIRIGALLHDIGKIGIADAVLQKPGKLTDEEFALIKEHPSIGRRILEGVRGFCFYLDVVELHHENWDGTGYPHKLQGESVPLGARIVHVVDAYDAMTSDRPYRKGMSHSEAMKVLQKSAGSQFDPSLVQVFAELASDFVEPPGPPEMERVASLDRLMEALNSAGHRTPERISA
jgi:HD-GYP domain-containing protein (c-di-GMP phosphodiesterase class II)